MSSTSAAEPTGRPRSNSLEGSHGVVIAGSYEGGLHGWRLGEASTGELTFSFAAHDGCCRCVAASEKTLLSGGDDEKIRVYSLRSGRQVGAGLGSLVRSRWRVSSRPRGSSRSRGSLETASPSRVSR